MLLILRPLTYLFGIYDAPKSISYTDNLYYSPSMRSTCSLSLMARLTLYTHFSAITKCQGRSEDDLFVNISAVVHSLMFLCTRMRCVSLVLRVRVLIDDWKIVLFP